MGEAISHGETLHRRTWRDVGSRAAAAAVPRLFVEGWRQDARRRGLFVPALIGIGAGIYFALPFEPSVWWALAALPATIAWIVAARREALVTVGYVLAGIAAVMAGFALALVRVQFVGTASLGHETHMLNVIGRVEALEPADKGRVRLRLRLASTEPQLRVMPARVRVSINKAEGRLAPGDWVEVRARLRPLPAPVAPGSFDFGRKLWFSGIGAVGFSLSPVTKLEAAEELTSLEAAGDWVERLRRGVSDRILASMSPRAGPIAAAFLTGERGLISDDDNQAMRDSSLAHLLSISGVHMALAGFGLFGVLRLAFAFVPSVSLNYPVKKWAAGAALVGSVAYLLLSGASVPTQRSFVTVAVALVAIIFDRSALNMRTVAIAACIVLALTPEAWIDPSFQMSFAAVVALVAAYEWWYARRIPDAETPSWFVRGLRLIGAAAATSFVAGLATAPFGAFHFNRFAEYGVAANVLVTPIVGFVIMPAGVLSLVLMPFGLEAYPLGVMEWGIDTMLSIAHWVARWPGATLSIAAWPLESLVLIVGGGLWVCIWQAAWRWFGVLPIAAGLVVATFSGSPDLLITGDGDNVAIRGGDGLLHFLSPRRGRFDAEMWLRRDGDSRDVADALKDDGSGFACDDAGCLGRVGGRLDRPILVAWSGEALAEDCANVAVAVDLGPGSRPPCVSAQLSVTRKMLSAEGAISARFVDDKVVWTSVARERGDRPWAMHRP